jgi:hypothetical protein
MESARAATRSRLRGAGIARGDVTRFETEQIFSLGCPGSFPEYSPRSSTAFARSKCLRGDQMKPLRLLPLITRAAPFLAPTGWVRTGATRQGVPGAGGAAPPPPRGVRTTPSLSLLLFQGRSFREGARAAKAPRLKICSVSEKQIAPKFGAMAKGRRGHSCNN